MTKEEHEAALQEIEKLIDKDPAKGTPAGDRLGALAVQVQDYERDLFDVARKRMAVWKRIVKEPLFQFLKHDPTGRTILALLANGQISLGKAAEAITEKFSLGLDPMLPKWRGYAEDVKPPSQPKPGEEKA